MLSMMLPLDHLPIARAEMYPPGEAITIVRFKSLKSLAIMVIALEYS